jgi:serine/threonine protein phosphatase PrpC
MFLHQTIVVSYFAVYDGHGGDECSRFISKNLYKFIRAEVETIFTETYDFRGEIGDAILTAFTKCD